MDKRKKQGALAAVIIVIAVAAVIAYAVMSAKPLTWQNDGPPLSSSGSQDIAPFTMNNTWRVAWKISPMDPIFVLAVYQQNSTGGFSWVADTGVMTTNSTQGFLSVYYTGTFVMRVVASNDTQWVLYIQEPKTA